CLWWPSRRPSPNPRLDLAALGKLTFEAPDLDRFPALRMTRQALEAGGWATNILNAANEVAVAAFLSGAIGYLEIAGLVETVLDRAGAAGIGRTPQSVDDALALDREGRRLAMEQIGRQTL